MDWYVGSRNILEGMLIITARRVNSIRTQHSRSHYHLCHQWHIREKVVIIAEGCPVLLGGHHHSYCLPLQWPAQREFRSLVLSVCVRVCHQAVDRIC